MDLVIPVLRGTFGEHDSDWVTFPGASVRTPVMYKRNMEWAQAYNSWLSEYASELYRHGTWRGGNIQLGDPYAFPGSSDIGTAAPGDSLWLMRFRFGNNAALPLIDTTSVWETYPSLLPGHSNDSIFQLLLPNSLCWYVTGYFQDTTNKNWYLYIVNPYTDSHNAANGKWVDNYDSTFTRRGERTLHFHLRLSSASQYYNLTYSMQVMIPNAWHSMANTLFT